MSYGWLDNHVKDKTMTIQLCPEENSALELLTNLIPKNDILVLFGATGMGKTTTLRELQRRLNTAFISTKEFFDSSKTCHPLALDQAIGELLWNAIKSHDLVIIDDFHLANFTLNAHHLYPRFGFFNNYLTEIG